MAEKLPPRSKSFSKWYNQLVQRAELADYGPARGTMVIRPYGYALWEHVMGALDKEIKAAGVDNAYFPLFIPMSLLNKESEHVQGFAPHLAVVTHGGGKKLDEPLAVRPTSETIMYPFYQKWIKSYRDLPVLINQWNNVVRWELRTTLFLRTMEFLWQEGHTAHATQEEAWTEVRRALSMYEKVYRESMAIPGYAGRKSDSEKFAGADATTTYELLMRDGKALQGCTSHALGQNFSKPFDITFQDKDGKNQYVWQTSWGFTTRSIGALIMVHGDDKGLRLPPRVAPCQVVIVPVYPKNQIDNQVQSQCIELGQTLKQKGVRVKVDSRDINAGTKFYEYEEKGIPVRVEIGPTEAKGSKYTVYRRDADEKVSLSKAEFEHEGVDELLEDIQQTLYREAETFLAENTREATDYSEFKNIIEKKRGMIRAFWCEDPACEATIKEETKATTRCLPFDAPEEKGSCVHCEKPAKHRWYFAQSY